MSELSQNLATKEWVVIAAERGTRIQVNTILPELSAKMLRECRTC